MERVGRYCLTNMRNLRLSLLLIASGLFGADDGFVSLMPKKDVTELWTIEITPPETWRVEGNEIVCAGKPNGFLRSKKVYKDYVFRAEWKFKKEGWVPRPEDEGWPNAGFFISAGPIVKGWPTSIEVQGHFGEAGSVFGVRGGKVSGAKRGPIVKNRIPFGEWDKYEVTSKDGRVTVVLNGELVNEAHDIYPAEGNICLQSEGWEVYYRNVAIKELK
jgi:3-keto-disaccharide hydrolase